MPIKEKQKRNTAVESKMCRSLVPLFLNCEILFALIESGINPYIERERGHEEEHSAGRQQPCSIQPGQALGAMVALFYM